MAQSRQEAINILMRDYNLGPEEAAKVADMFGVISASDVVGSDLEKSSRGVKDMSAAVLELGEAFVGLGNSSAAFTEFARSSGVLNEFNGIAGEVVERLLAVADRSLELSIQAEETQASFNRLTGQMGKFNDGLVEGFRRNLEFGASLDDSSRAYGAVLRNTTDFTRKSSEQQDALIDTMIVLEKFGVSQYGTAQGFEIMTRGMGMTDEAARQVFPDMVAMAAEMGMEANELTQQFTTNADKFAVFGDKGVHNFRRLAAESRRSGVSMEGMLNTVGQFDTFTGAADKVQGLNALLGGTYLDTVDMMMTVDPTERMLKIRKAVEDAGYTQERISAMGETQAYYFRTTLAERMGMSVLDFNKLMSESGEEFAKNATDASSSLSELESATKFGRTTADQINILKDQAAVAATEFLVPVREEMKNLALEMSEQVYGPMAEDNKEFFKLLGDEAAGGVRKFGDQAVGYAVEFRGSIQDQLKAALEMIREVQAEIEKTPVMAASPAAAGAAAGAALTTAAGAPAGTPITVENLQLKIDGQNFFRLLDGQVLQTVGKALGFSQGG